MLLHPVISRAVPRFGCTSCSSWNLASSPNSAKVQLWAGFGNNLPVEGRPPAFRIQIHLFAPVMLILIYKLDLDILKVCLHSNVLSRSRLWKVGALQTDRHTVETSYVVPAPNTNALTYLLTQKMPSPIRHLSSCARPHCLKRIPTPLFSAIHHCSTPLLQDNGEDCWNCSVLYCVCANAHGCEQFLQLMN